MGFRLSGGIGPLRVSVPLSGGKRRRKSASRPPVRKTSAAELKARERRATEIQPMLDDSVEVNTRIFDLLCEEKITEASYDAAEAQIDEYQTQLLNYKYGLRDTIPPPIDVNVQAVDD